MKTVKDAIDTFKRELAGVYDAQETESISLLVLIELLNTSKAKLKAFPEGGVTDQQAGQLQSILNELKTGKPVQYILGHTEFYGLPFHVSPAVLIPRPETEELVQWIIQTAEQAATPIKTILDIGTGSGCIPVTLKKHLPDTEIFAIDISAEALKVAKSNASLNQIDVSFIEADILDFDPTIQLPRFDIIVSNPPYVTETDKQQMHHNVVDFEPHTALFVPEDDPLVFYKAITDFALKHLNRGGQLFFEINESYGKQTVELLSYKLFNDIELRNDLIGRDRMIKATL